MTRPAELARASEAEREAVFPGPAHASGISFMAGLLEQDGGRYWHILATGDGRWFHSMERFPESEKAAAQQYLLSLRGPDATSGE
jgi:hypothetical protein